jgi:hypothetical protein
MAVFVALSAMALLAAFTMWLPVAARRSDALDRLIALVAMAGQCAPLHGRESLTSFPPGSGHGREVDGEGFGEVGGPGDRGPLAVLR